jgi:hypothetical protein
MGHFITAVLGKLVADECKAWLPWITGRMTKLAVRRLPKRQRERYEEEWASYLDEVPGELAKLWVAYGFLKAARIASAERWDASRTIAFVLVLFLWPVISAVTIAVRLNSFSAQNVFPRRYVSRDGRVFWLSRFLIVRPEPVELILHKALRASLSPTGIHIRTSMVHYSAWRNSRLTSFEEYLRRTGFVYLPTLVEVARGHIPADIALESLRRN